MKKILTMFPFWIVIALSYYFLPSFINDVETAFIIFLVVIPLICLIISIIYGINNSLSIIYVVLVGILFIPVNIMFPLFEIIWVFPLVYGIIALIGNTIGMKFFKSNIRIKSIEKYGHYLIFVIWGSYIVAVVISFVMMNQIKQITYNKFAYGTIMSEDIIDFETNTTERKYYNFYGEIHIQEENTIDTIEKLKIKIICAFSLFPLWQKNYNNPYIMDGDQYEIIGNYGNSESIIYGSNAYPLTYHFVMMTIESVIK